MRRYGKSRQARIRTARSRQRALIRAGRRALAPTRFRNIRTGGFLGQELKFYDTKLISSALTAPSDATAGEHDPSGTIVLNSVIQGDGEQQRDGRKMTMKSLYINGTVTVGAKAAQNSADGACQVFIAVVCDTQTNGATIISEQVFKNVGANAKLAASPMRNLEFITRYKVLGHRVITLANPTITNATSFSADNGVIQSGLSRPFKFFIKLGDMGVTFNGTTETVANITDNSLHLLAWTSDTNLAPALSYGSRLRFMG